VKLVARVTCHVFWIIDFAIIRGSYSTNFTGVPPVSSEQPRLCQPAFFSIGRL
jgi:hypothetical protein